MEIKGNKRTNIKKALITTVVGVAAFSASAFEVSPFGTNLPPIDFHGLVSQGFLYSDTYNYLDTDTKNGSFRYSEAGVNASMNPFPRTHIAIQGFMFDVGDAGKYEPFLDYASIDYTFNDYIGVRGGRIRKPGGIYNHIQDVDLARTYVLLPQGIYDARFRDLDATLDGGEIFGNLPLGKGGSLSYEAYGGLVNVSDDSGLYGVINNSLFGGKVSSFDQFLEPGAQLWWNTPVDGLRFGASLCYVENFNYDFTEPSGAAPPAPANLSLRAEGSIPIQQYSAEYLWKNWTFQAEFYDLQISQDTISPFGKSHSFSADYAWYADASYRFNKWLEVGAYYMDWNTAGSPPAVSSDGFQKDLALSIRFDPKPWWIVKVEGHYIHGTGLLYDNGANPSRNDDGWFMLAVKTTFSF
ncbi:MAG TPA: hypothetical protein VH251_04275 [Verrucomicrobiae bacterium]|jgi:hypothetical protein|nr:hypothetical protein [Verrucomicrobiae bacterium]